LQLRRRLKTFNPNSARQAFHLPTKLWH